MPQSPNFLTPFLLVIDLVVFAALLSGLWLALRRARLPSTTRRRTWLAVTAVLVVWYGLVSYLSMQGAFQATPDVKFPAIVVAVLLPIIGGLWLIVRSRTMTAVIDATPLSWLVAIQTYRVAGFVFLILLSMHQLPAQFALPAGKGDILVGLLAVPVAWMIHKGSRASNSGRLCLEHPRHSRFRRRPCDRISDVAGALSDDGDRRSKSSGLRLSAGDGAGLSGAAVVHPPLHLHLEAATAVAHGNAPRSTGLIISLTTGSRGGRNVTPPRSAWQRLSHAPRE